MKAILSMILLTILCSCGRGNLRQFMNQGETLIPEASGTEELSIYIEQMRGFKNVSDLNEESRVLNFLDKVVFLNPDFFLEKKESLSRTDFLVEEDLKEVDIQKKGIQVSSVSFCSESLRSLEEEESRYSKKLVSISQPSYVNIISLIPKELLAKKRDQNIYCSFIFKFKDKTYVLIQQEINTSFPTHKSYKISLSNPEEEFKLIQTGELLSKEDLENIIIYNEMEEEVTKYELFCEGQFLLSISSGEKYAFKSLFENMPSKNNSNEAKTCVFYATHNENVRAISRHFQIDFSSFSPQKERLELSEIEESFFRSYKKNLTGTMVFRDFDKITHNKDYSHIDMLVDSQCFDFSYFSRQVFTKRTRTPFKAEIPMMSLFPEEIFFLISINGIAALFEKEFLKKEYSKALSEIKDSQKLHSLVEEFISNKKELKAIRDLSHEIYEIELEEKEEDEIDAIYEDKSQFECIYTLTLEDKTKSDSQKVFENLFYSIRLPLKKQSFSGYGLNYIKSTSPVESIIFDVSEMKYWIREALEFKSTDLSNLKYRTYKNQLFELDRIDSIDYDLGTLRIDSLDEISFDKMSFKCYTQRLENEELGYDKEDFTYVESHWDFDSEDREPSIYLKSFLNDEGFEKKIQ